MEGREVRTSRSIETCRRSPTLAVLANQDNLATKDERSARLHAEAL